jgi:hypothetical protein
MGRGSHVDKRSGLRIHHNFTLPPFPWVRYDQDFLTYYSVFYLKYHVCVVSEQYIIVVGVSG